MKIYKESVFLVVKTGSSGGGHGDPGLLTLNLSGYGVYDVNLYPAFKTRKEAENFVKKVKSEWSNPSIIEFPLYPIENKITIDGVLKSK